MTFGGLKRTRRAVVAKATGPEAVEALRRAADRMEPKIAGAFRAALNDLRDRVGEDAIADAIREGGPDAVLRLFPSAMIDDVFQPVAAAISNAALEGAKVGAAVQPPVVGAQGQTVNFVFNATNPRVSGYAQRQTVQRVREVTEDVKSVVRNVVREETLAGTNPRDAARRVRESVGLTAKQERAVSNYRRMLEQQQFGEAQTRQLRDRRFDATMNRAARTGEALSDAQINRMTERYRQRYVKYRAEVIARTEALRALNGGHHELFQSYIDEGKIEERQVRRFWVYTQDDRTRADHRLIPSMNENGVGQNEPFKTPMGELMYPGDPSGLPEQVINCRCTVFPRIVSLELLEDG